MSHKEGLPIYEGGAGIIVKDRKTGKVLLGKRTDHQGWSIAGGKQEPGETMKDCALREMQEEFGICADPKDVYYCGKIFARARVKGREAMVISDTYRYDVEDGSLLEITPQPEEMVVVKWFSFEEFALLGKIFEPSLASLNKYAGFTELESDDMCQVVEKDGLITLYYQDMRAEVEFKSEKRIGVVHDSGIKVSFEGRTLDAIIQQFKSYVNSAQERARYNQLLTRKGGEEMVTR